MGVRERGAAQQESDREVGCEEKHSTQLKHPGDGQHLPCERKQSLVGHWLGGDTQRAAQLEQQQTEKHEPLAENGVNAAKVRKDAWPNREDHCGSKTNCKGMARCAPDASVLIGKCSPDTH